MNQQILPKSIQDIQTREAQRLMSNKQVQNANQMIPSQQQIMQQGNPFAGSMQTGGVPDVPIQYSGGMTDVLIGNSDVPEETRKKFWWIFNKDNVLTFLDDDRKKSKMLNFDIIKIDILNSKPYYDYDFEFEKNWDILRNSFETKLDRALGFKGQNIKNERIVLQSQFSEMRQISENGGQGQMKEGFFKRLLGRR